MRCQNSNTLGKKNSNNIDVKEIDHINYEYKKKARSQTNTLKTQLNGKLEIIKSGDFQIDLIEILREKKRKKLERLK